PCGSTASRCRTRRRSGSPTTRASAACPFRPSTRSRTRSPTRWRRPSWTTSTRVTPKGMPAAPPARRSPAWPRCCARRCWAGRCRRSRGHRPSPTASPTCSSSTPSVNRPRSDPGSTSPASRTFSRPVLRVGNLPSNRAISRLVAIESADGPPHRRGHLGGEQLQRVPVEVPEVADEVVAPRLLVVADPRPHLLGRSDEVPSAESGVVGELGDAPRQPLLADAVHLLLDSALVGRDDDVPLPAHADLGRIPTDARTMLGDDLGLSGDIGRRTVEVAPVAVAGDEGQGA